MEKVFAGTGIKISAIVLILVFALLGTAFGANAVSAQSASPPSAAGLPAITSISFEINPTASPPASPIPNHAYADIQVSIDVSGFNLVNKTGQPNVPGEGHIIYYVAHPPAFPYYPAYSASGTYSAGTPFTTFTWFNFDLTVWPYWVLSAQLVNNDDTPLNPPVYAEIVTNFPLPNQTAPVPMISSFSLTAQPPSSPLASPAPNATYLDVTLSAQVDGFQLVSPDQAQGNRGGMGHLLYYSWVDPITIPGLDAYVDGYSLATIENPTTDNNALADYFAYAVQLVNNDDTALDFPVYAVIKTNPPSGTAASGTPSSPTGVPASPSLSVPPFFSIPSSGPIILVTAHRLAFSVGSITVSPGAGVHILFSNEDEGIPHNISVYADPTATIPIFQGDAIDGPGSIDYLFTAPSGEGTYFFRCDFHPTQMFGAFIVKAP